MNFYLQFGYGMMSLSEQLITEWGGGCVILSPRDLKPEQLRRIARTINGLSGGEVLLDPQFFVPHSDHEKLCSHDYWPASYETNVFWQGPELNDLVTNVRDLNRSLGCRQFVLPGLLATQVTEDWLEIQRAVLAEAQSIESDLPLVSTIALGADACRDADQITSVLEAAEGWNPDGYYVVCEHPDGNYLVDDTIWLANVLDLIAGLRLLGKETIVGYCNHQMLAAAIAKPTAICSGTFMNVRSFPPDKFNAAVDDDIRQKKPWYYCPQALSEYRVTYLDIAQRRGVLDQMTPEPALDGGHAALLFGRAQPTTVDFGERAAFLHYLHALRGQTERAVQSTFDDTYAHHESTLESAENILTTLTSVGVRGQQRDFSDIVDVNRAAIADLESLRGAMLRRRWAEL